MCSDKTVTSGGQPGHTSRIRDRYTSTMRDKIRKKNPENHIVGFLKNLFANYGGK
jgi:hypothetical protein